jgi:hypothetical protein
MKPALNRFIVSPLPRFYDSMVLRFNVLTMLACVLMFPLFTRAQFSPAQTGSSRSISGQFLVIGAAENSPLADSPSIATNADFVRLEPALLAVSAERLKQSLWRELDLNPNTPWRGRIFFALHPAQSLDEEVTIVAKPSGGGWAYQVQLPDALPRTRFARALTGVLLLEFANRNAAARSVEIPDWLTDGLSQELLAAGSPEIILSSPDKMVNDLPVTQINTTGRGADPLAAARRVLRNSPAATFEQLCWPTDAQLSGEDGGAYRASAQLFVRGLLRLKNGPAHLRAMLENLPGCYNWQTAFQNAFRGNFKELLDVEKWWALQVVGFAARDPGAQWTPAVSQAKLDEILSVPVEFRSASNALPARAEISLQAAIRNFDSDRRTPILQAKLRDLEIAQFRVAAPLAALTTAYRRALADYLGPDGINGPVRSANKHSPAVPRQVNARDTLKRLDELDARRRTVESTISPDNSMQPSLAPIKF